MMFQQLWYNRMLICFKDGSIIYYPSLILGIFLEILIRLICSEQGLFYPKLASPFLKLCYVSSPFCFTLYSIINALQHFCTACRQYYLRAGFPLNLNGNPYRTCLWCKVCSPLLSSALLCSPLLSSALLCSPLLSSNSLYQVLTSSRLRGIHASHSQMLPQMPLDRPVAVLSGKFGRRGGRNG